jgi:hypothetical protein
MRKTVVAGVTAILTGLSAAVVALPAEAAPATGIACATNWGAGPRHKDQMVQTKVRAVRAGVHACFDRLVIDLGAGRAPGYRVSYVGAFHADGSGQLVRTSGHAKLLVVVRAPAAAVFNASNRHLVNVAGFPVFRQVAGLGSFEGITSLGVGLTAKKAFRVLEFRDASHRFVLVIDVARH